MKNPFRPLTQLERLEITIQEKRNELLQAEFNLSRARAAVASARANLTIADNARHSLVHVGRSLRNPNDGSDNRLLPDTGRSLYSLSGLPPPKQPAPRPIGKKVP